MAQHPVVDTFIRSNQHLLEILKGHQKGDPVVQAMQHLHEALVGNRISAQAMQEAENLAMEVTDPDLFILFFAIWAHLAAHEQRFFEVSVIIRRQQTLLGDKTPPEIRAVVIENESLLAMVQGDMAGHEKKLREALAALPVHSPRRLFRIMGLGFYLAQQGRLMEIETEIDWLARLRKVSFKMNTAAVLRFINAVETGLLEDACKLIPIVQNDPHKFPGHHLTRSFEQYIGLLKMMQGQPETQDASITSAGEVIQCLLAHDVKGALAKAREQAKEDMSPTGLTHMGFYSLNLIRAELSAGHEEAARRLIKMRQNSGCTHYLDDFFLARADLLAGKEDQAAGRLAATARAVEYYHAQGRLEFETHLAGEWSLGDTVRLAFAAAKAAGHANEKTEGADTDSDDKQKIIGQSREMAAVREIIARFAPLDTSVLITGETGTGKELVAQALCKTGPRQNEPFIAVNCGAISESLLESELFGHVHGAFTGAAKARQGFFEEAGKGIVFLDEIGEISPRLQVALLRVLEENEIRPVGSSYTRKISCRILAATNRDLDALAAEGRFRKDLLFRLKQLEIYIPPLRDRQDDILLLVHHFLGRDRGKGVYPGVSMDLKEALIRYDWPGNVRELRNTIERMRLLHSDKLSYGLEDLEIHSQKFQEGITRRTKETRLSETLAFEDIGEGAHWQITDTKDIREPESPVMKDIDRFLRHGQSSLRRLDRIRELFERYQKLTRREIIQIIGASPSTVTHDLKTLRAEGLIEKVEPSSAPRTHYFVLRKPRT